MCGISAHVPLSAPGRLWAPGAGISGWAETTASGGVCGGRTDRVNVHSDLRLPCESLVEHISSKTCADVSGRGAGQALGAERRDLWVGGNHGLGRGLWRVDGPSQRPRLRSSFAVRIFGRTPPLKTCTDGSGRSTSCGASCLKPQGAGDMGTLVSAVARDDCDRSVTKTHTEGMRVWHPPGGQAPPNVQAPPQRWAPGIQGALP